MKEVHSGFLEKSGSDYQVVPITTPSCRLLDFQDFNVGKLTNDCTIAISFHSREELSYETLVEGNKVTTLV